MGDMLTEPIAGTNLPANKFLTWMLDQGFSLQTSSGQTYTLEEAAFLMESNISGDFGSPLIRITRNIHGRTKVQFNIYAGAECEEMQEMSRLGNLPSLTSTDKYNYANAAKRLGHPFISKGTKGERSSLGIGDVDILCKLDDCFASGITGFGDALIDEVMQYPKHNLVEIYRGIVGTTQFMVLATLMAQHRRVSTIYDIGAPGFGLGGKDEGLNYIVNTTKRMRSIGRYTVGDMGNNLDTGDSASAQPSLITARTEEESVRELRTFLGGGLFMIRTLDAELSQRGKPARWDRSIRRASRVDNGSKQWGVLMSGTDLIVRPARRDRIYLKAKTAITDHEGKPTEVPAGGLWVSPGIPEGGLLPVTFREGKHLITLYTYTKA